MIIVLRTFFIRSERYPHTGWQVKLTTENTATASPTCEAVYPLIVINETRKVIWIVEPAQ